MQPARHPGILASSAVLSCQSDLPHRPAANGGRSLSENTASPGDFREFCGSKSGQESTRGLNGGGRSPERTALPRPDSLLSGINTGIFSLVYAENTLALSVYPTRRVLRAFLHIRPRRNREFNFSYQGMVIVYLGKLRPISELRHTLSPRYCLDSANSRSSMRDARSVD